MIGALHDGLRPRELDVGAEPFRDRKIGGETSRKPSSGSPSDAPIVAEGTVGDWVTLTSPSKRKPADLAGRRELQIARGGGQSLEASVARQPSNATIRSTQP